jgi:hypothetical protein
MNVSIADASVGDAGDMGDDGGGSVGTGDCPCAVESNRCEMGTAIEAAKANATMNERKNEWPIPDFMIDRDGGGNACQFGKLSASSWWDFPVGSLEGPPVFRGGVW